jgi:hypothetical protein
LASYHTYHNVAAVLPMSLPLPDVLTAHYAIRDALWPYLYLLTNTTPSDEPWIPVAGGIWVSNEQLAYRIDVGVPTIERWRKRLERAGYLRCELVRPRFRKMWLVNMNAVRREQTLVEAPASSAVN